MVSSFESKIQAYNELKRRLQENIVDIKNKECDPLCEAHLNYFRNTENYPLVPVLLRDNTKLQAERNICRRINDLFESNAPAYEKLKNETIEYEKELNAVDWSDRGIIAEPINTMEIIFLITCFPVFIMGLTYWGSSYFISKIIADHKVTRIDFHDSVTVNVTNVIFPFFVIITMLISYPFIGLYCILIALILPLISLVATWYFDLIVRIVQRQKANSSRKKLLTLRYSIINQIFN